MGETQKKSDFITLLQQLRPILNPQLRYEQYLTDAVAAADLLFHIAFEQGDLQDALVLDLGCGNGILGIGALLLGAPFVIGVEIDPAAGAICRENLNQLGLISRYALILGDLTQLILANEISVIRANSVLQFSKTVALSNPPFGTRQRGVDVSFLRQGIANAQVVYSLHLFSASTDSFLSEKITTFGGIITHRFRLNLLIKPSYPHHRQRMKTVHTIVYRIVHPKD